MARNIYVLYFYCLAYFRAQQRRKLYEKQLSVVDGTLTTLEVQRQALDSAQLNEEINELTENNADTLNQEQKRVDIDKVSLERFDRCMRCCR